MDDRVKKQPRRKEFICLQKNLPSNFGPNGSNIWTAT
jgi:hypothetical protein